MIAYGIPLREHGQRHGRPAEVPFGYRMVKGTLVPFKKEQAVVVKIKQMRVRAPGMTLRKIAAKLNEWKIPTKCKAEVWHPEMVRRVLLSQYKPNIRG
ncbi:MAG: recombinase family protein [Oligoflexia bacterium]|nr:recombinase family protein [Oligoflexia bacterium]